ncbi:MAG: helix-turn-helix transcriptional regulator, partial [Eubacteriales bacterium]
LILKSYCFYFGDHDMSFFMQDLQYMAGYFDSDPVFPQMIQSPPRTTDRFELEFFFTDYTTCMNGKPYRIPAGSVLRVLPGTLRWSDLPFRNYYLKLTDEGGDIQQFLESIPELFPTRNLDIYISHINNIVWGQHEKNPWKILQSISAILSTLKQETDTRYASLSDVLSDSSLQLRRNICDRAIAYMKENLYTSCSLSDLAAAAHVSPIYFHSVFKSVHGITPLSYLTQMRMERAKILLQTQSMSPAQIAEACGFASETISQPYSKSISE